MVSKTLKRFTVSAAVIVTGLASILAAAGVASDFATPATFEEVATTCKSTGSVVTCLRALDGLFAVPAVKKPHPPSFSIVYAKVAIQTIIYGPASMPTPRSAFDRLVESTLPFESTFGISVDNVLSKTRSFLPLSPSTEQTHGNMFVNTVTAVLMTLGFCVVFCLFGIGLIGCRIDTSTTTQSAKEMSRTLAQDFKPVIYRILRDIPFFQLGGVSIFWIWVCIDMFLGTFTFWGCIAVFPALVVAFLSLDGLFRGVVAMRDDWVAKYAKETPMWIEWKKWQDELDEERTVAVDAFIYDFWTDHPQQALAHGPFWRWQLLKDSKAYGDKPQHIKNMSPQLKGEILNEYNNGVYNTLKNKWLVEEAAKEATGEETAKEASPMPYEMEGIDD